MALSETYALELGNQNLMMMQCSPQAKNKVYWEGVAWVEPVTALIFLALPNSYSKENLSQYPLIMLGRALDYQMLWVRL